ncbi:MAG: hypothetical protein K6T85_12990, partial [Gorillibacterium sp.]|nr:hypothetical protein [Gorillibacterium sp.]
YALYAQLLGDFLEDALPFTEELPETATYLLPSPMDVSSYDHADLLSPHNAEHLSGWRRVSNWAFEQKCYWKLPAEILLGETAGACFRIQFHGTAIGFTMLAGMDLGNIDYSIDGETYVTVQLFDRSCSLFYRPKIVLLADELVSGNHTVDIRISAEKHEQSTGHMLRILHFMVNK